ncbi:cell division protein ZapE [Nocardia camponoti]|uniref:Cell division protein ZapE n=1 Tax=Nocardia camponoti TaxID=1616106 RepID=A0A917QMV8_9NOCA|nr:cell division protein ZapE [Nocardia camponoti]GGK59918.1 cell division protein ZapE [Nocardia camponoti]
MTGVAMTFNAVTLDADQQAALSALTALLDRHGRARRKQRGLYLHGRPGRGKTMVMDRFFADVRTAGKRRFHFHTFFAALHERTHATGSIETAVSELLGDTELVCFDEFHVNDIGDGMLIARMLDVLFARKIVLVVTSNQPPQGLLPNPLFHDRFVPTIERILSHVDVLSLDGPLDYRTIGTQRDSGFLAGHYLLDETARPGTLCVEIGNGRTVFATEATDDAVAFTFEQLCGTPTSAADYLRLTARFKRWTLRGVPLLRDVPLDHAMRLVNLIDVLYDADLPTTIAAAALPKELIADVHALPDLARTASRLGELKVGVSN